MFEKNYYKAIQWNILNLSIIVYFIEYLLCALWYAQIVQQRDNKDKGWETLTLTRTRIEKLACHLRPGAMT